MYRTYQQPTENQIFISSWDGDCTYYTVFESQEEKEAEQKRVATINKESREMYLDYLSNCETY